MGLLSRLFKRKSKKKKKSVGTVPTDDMTTSELLKDWSKTIERVENHPLSQARVINTGLLNDLTHILASMDERLEKLSKLDEIISLLESTRDQLKGAGLSTDSVDAAISGLKGLTVKDREALKLFKDNGPFTTKAFAKKAGLSRSTASSRLNKLFSLGLLDKEAEGKKIIYKLKQ